MAKSKPLGSFFSQFPIIKVAAVLLSGALAPACLGQVNLAQNSSTNWTITNGLITVVYDPTGQDVSSVQLGVGAGAGPNLAPNDLSYYSGAPLGPGVATPNDVIGPGGSYVDVWVNDASQHNSTNPLTYAFHFVVFANDPTVYTYEVLSHGSSDPATKVTLGQVSFNNSGSLNNIYQINTSPNNLNYGAQTTTTIPSTNANYAGVKTARGSVQASTSTIDVSGATGISTTSSYWGTSNGDNGSNFFGKYDYSTYDQYNQSETMYNSSYAVSEVTPSPETLLGGPTKQELAFTDPDSLTEQFVSDNYGVDLGPGGAANGNPGDGLSFAAFQVATKEYGPFGFTISSTAAQTAAQINQAAINNISSDLSEFNQDTALTSSGYATTGVAGQRGAVLIMASNSATYTTYATGVQNIGGWSQNSNDNVAVLSDNNTNMQETSVGNYYSTNLTPSGNGYIPNVTPGTYRLSLYENGQWGTTVYNNVTVQGLYSDGYHSILTVPGYGGTSGQGLAFVPENFSSSPPIWTIGEPNRSANEFTNGHDSSVQLGSSGPDMREYQGGYDYWAEEAALGNPGTVVYYATSVGATPATNDPNAWLANQWYTFNPNEWDASNSSNDEYSKICPAYVTSGGGPAAYHGAPWTVHFTTTAAQQAQGQYVVLSVGLSDMQSNLVVSLNGHSETWTSNSLSPDNAMATSGQAAFYQWAAFQFPTSDLNAALADNTFTFQVSSPSGVMYDALRMEITNSSAAPANTGWYDYNYITGTQTGQDDALGLTPNDLLVVPEPSGLILAVAMGLAAPLVRPRRRSVAAC